MTTSAVAALEVADEKFLVASLIERCPKAMMIRELMKNAIEAAEQAPEGKRLIELSSVEIDGVSKLCIWNTGPSMDAGELLRICNIASSLGKQKSLTGNFGMGAKVASLPSNQRGMRYRSCKNGRIHEVIICKRDGVYAAGAAAWSVELDSSTCLFVLRAFPIARRTFCIASPKSSAAMLRLSGEDAV